MASQTNLNPGNRVVNPATSQVVAHTPISQKALEQRVLTLTAMVFQLIEPFLDETSVHNFTTVNKSYKKVDQEKIFKQRFIDKYIKKEKLFSISDLKSTLSSINVTSNYFKNLFFQFKHLRLSLDADNLATRAAEKGCTETLELLITNIQELPVQLNSYKRNPWGDEYQAEPNDNNLFLIAAQLHHLDMVRMLMKYTSERVQGIALHRVIQNREIDTATVLLENRALIQHRDNSWLNETKRWGNLPFLNLAVSTANPDMVRLLLNHKANIELQGADPNIGEGLSDLMTPLASAVRSKINHNTISIVRILIENRADINSHTFGGGDRTPFTHAVFISRDDSKYIEIVNLIVNHARKHQIRLVDLSRVITEVQRGPNKSEAIKNELLGLLTEAQALPWNR